MRSVSLLLLVVVTACTGRDSEPPDAARQQSAIESLSAPPNYSAPVYAIRDTADWECGGNGGRFGRLYADSTYIDSIDLFLGIQVTPRGILFYPVRSAPEPDIGLVICPADPVLLAADGNRRGLETILPHFHPWFSSPKVIDSAIYYCGIVGDSVYALKYAFSSGTTQKTFLTEVAGTDNRYHYRPPERSGTILRYATSGRTFLLTADLLLLPDSAPLGPPN